MTPEGYRVSIYRIVSPDVSSSDFTLRMNATHFVNTYDVRFQEEQYWAGDILVIDFANFALKHIQSLMSIPILKKYVHCSQVSIEIWVNKYLFVVRYMKVWWMGLSEKVYDGRVGHVESSLWAELVSHKLV